MLRFCHVLLFTELYSLLLYVPLVCVHVCVCLPAWVPTCMHVEARGWRQCHSFFPPYWGGVSHLNPQVSDCAPPAVQLALGTPCLPPDCWNYSHLALRWVLDISPASGLPLALPLWPHIRLLIAFLKSQVLGQSFLEYISATNKHTKGLLHFYY